MKLDDLIKVYKTGEDILTTIAAPISPDEFNTESVIQLVNKLKTIAQQMGAVGFSAPQIGYSKRVMTIGMEFDNPRRPNVKQFQNMIFINPQLTYTSPEMAEDWEGCASFDTVLAYVSRPISIGFTAYDIKGNVIEGQLSNFPARVFQHELDHLNGVLMNTKAIESKEFDRERDRIISLKS